MKRPSRSLIFYAILAALLLNLMVLSTALVFIVLGSSTPDKKEVKEIVAQYLKVHPEVIRNVFIDLIKNPDAAVADAQGGALPGGPSDEEVARNQAQLIRANSEIIFHSPHQVVLGNPKGKTSLVVFFDYNCGFCRSGLADMLGLMKKTPSLRIVLKEYPILSEASVEAAKIGIALRMQDKTGKKYLSFHERLLNGGTANTETAIAAARAAGADMGRLGRDLTSGEIQATLSETFNLGTKLGINGTPSYVVGDRLIVGKVGEAALADAVKTAAPL